MTNKPHIQILMATYNGEAYLSEQLRSIAAQTHQNWHLLVRDDGSNDRTVDILRGFRAQFPDKLTLIHDQRGNLGATQNFLEVLKSSTADILSFADQDDIWFPHKMERSLTQLQTMIHRHGNNRPLLVHHDFTVVNGNRSLLTPSFDAVNGYRRSVNCPDRMPFRGYVHGFTMMFNRALREAVLPAPVAKYGHDTWMGCVAEDLGEISYVAEQLAEYRRHGNNASHAESYPRRALRAVIAQKGFGPIGACIRNTFQAAHDNLQEKSEITAAYLARYKDQLSPARLRVMEGFAHIDDIGLLERKSLLLRYVAESPRSRVLASLIL